jgi:ATP-dependent RNA helicase RhlE
VPFIPHPGANQIQRQTLFHVDNEPATHYSRPPMTTFDTLGLIEPLLQSVSGQGYHTPTPIQVMAIPPLLDGRDVLGVAQTGTGKTAAFALPVLQRLAAKTRPGRRSIRALVLTPTRELATQIGDSFSTYAKYIDLKHGVVFGGVKQGPQVAALRRGYDILVATPGRLLDLCEQGHIVLDQVDFLVLDEADRMLDMGFIHDLRRILKLLPRDRQNLLFSATMPKAIGRLANDFLDDPVRVEVSPESPAVERIEQQVYFTEKSNKRRLLIHLLSTLDVERTIVFTRTKHGANRLVKSLAKAGFSAAAIHGNKTQNARTRALTGFRNGITKVLVATDVASRGIDIEGISHVFNFDLPNESESYVHRIGRTARAGREGIAISFCDDSEGTYLLDIQKLTGKPLSPVMEQPYHWNAAIPDPRAPRKKVPASAGRASRGRRGGRQRPRNRKPRS